VTTSSTAVENDNGATAARAVAPTPPTLSIGEALAGHRNSLGIIRLVLAIAVIFDHSFVIGAYFDGSNPVSSLTRSQATLGSIAVGGFFGISGYLIAKSGMNADVVQFVWRRFLRIFPAYWTALLVTALVVAPIVWVTSGRALSAFFTTSLSGPLGYLWGNWLLEVHNYGIYDIFQSTTPYGEMVGYSVFNGSIWTLYYEWLCYMIIALLVLFGVLVRARFLLPMAALLFVALEIVNLASPGAATSVVPFLGDPLLIKLAYTFLCGSTIAVYSKQVPFDSRLAIFALVLGLVSLRFGGFDIFGPPTMTYFFLWLAAWLPKGFQKIGSPNDYSYGVYVYGFLVQQLLAYVGVYRLGYLPFAIIAVVISTVFAWLSWHLVEKQAMRLKDWGPGRGVRYWYDRIRPARARTPQV
jgi:peptidoglycan/LPS O-acetylase OafA/YrhL